MSAHASPYALDRAALGAPAAPELAAHLARCARCSSALEARRAGGAVPPWLASVRVAPARVRRRRAWLLPVPALAAAAVAVAVVAVVFRPGDGGPVSPAMATREKGAPVVTIYVKRGDAVAEWDGRTPLRTGDRLRVGVRAPGFAHVSVASLSSPGEPALLYSGPAAPAGETLLPLSFRVDAAGGAEVLSVIASADPVALAAHREPTERARARGVFIVRLQLPKEAP